MKIVFVIPFYKRLDLTELCFSEVKKQKRPVFVAGSEGETSRLLADKYGMTYIECENYPVSNKHNKLISSLKNVDYDYAVILGSDNFVSENFTEKIEAILEEKKPDFLQIRGLYFYNQRKKLLTYFSGFTGVGRCYSKKSLEAINYKLWNNGLNKGLDGSSFRNLTNKGFKPLEVDIREIGVEVLDVKYSENITNHVVVNKGIKVDSISIDLSEIDKLKDYSKKRSINYRVVNKVKAKCLTTGKTKLLNVFLAARLVRKNKYKLL